jgi:5'-nucleotidase
MNVLFIGILTSEVLAKTKSEGLVGTMVDIEDAAQEVGKICDAYRNVDIDFTVLLTHIGFEEDKKLAAALDPAWGVDVIIGGHSHTYLTEPCEVAGIPIVQAAIGTDQIGRFDIMVDTDTNAIDTYTWQCIPITEENCPRDLALEEVMEKYTSITNNKYGRILTRFPRAYTHPQRNMETELGDLIAESMRDQLQLDLVLIASGSIRKPSLGPIVTLGDFMEVYPFGDPLISFQLTGSQLRRALLYMLRDEAFTDGDHCEWYQISRGLCCEYDRPTHTILSLKMNGKEVKDDELFTAAMERYHYLSIASFLGLTHEELEKNGKAEEAASRASNVLEEYFTRHELLKYDGEPRLIIHA